MRGRLGLYLGADRLAAVVVGRAGVLWHAEAPRDATQDLTPQLSALLGPAPRVLGGRAFAVLGPATAPVKELRTLPPLGEPQLLQRLIETTPTRYLPVASSDLAIALPARSPSGWWLSWTDASTLHQLEAACRSVRWPLHAVHPLPLLLLGALASSREPRPVVLTPPDTSARRIEWIDGLVTVTVDAHQSRVTSVRRSPRSLSDAGPPEAPLAAPLEALGREGWSLAGAYVAASGGKDMPLGFDWHAAPGRRPSAAIGRVAVRVLLGLGVAGALLGPGLAARSARQADDAAYALLHDHAARAGRARARLQALESVGRAVSDFATSRRLMTPLLASLSLQLPESTAIVELRLDTLAGHLTALAPLGVPLAERLSRTAGVSALQLSGPVSRESLGFVTLQRSSLRFRWAPAPATTPGQTR